MVVFEIKMVSDLVAILMYVINSLLPVHYDAIVIIVSINSLEDWLTNDLIGLAIIRVGHYHADQVAYLKHGYYEIKKPTKD